MTNEKLEKRFEKIKSSTIEKRIDEIVGEDFFKSLKQKDLYDSEKKYLKYLKIVNSQKRVNLQYNKKMYAFLDDLYRDEIENDK